MLPSSSMKSRVTSLSTFTHMNGPKGTGGRCKPRISVRNAAEGRTVPLSNGEFSLLVVMLGAPQRILTRDQLLDLSRLHNDEVYNRSVDVQIMRLRRKIEKDPAQPRYIKTERGAGYLFGVPVETVY